MPEGSVHTIPVLTITSSWGRMKGLLGEGMSARSVMFHTRFGIHTFGMEHPIDVVVLDGRQRVVRVRCRLPPFRMYIWPPVYRTVLELPDGTVAARGIAVGDTVHCIRDTA